MTPQEVIKTKNYLRQNHPDKQEELIDELDRYVATNNARNGNKMTFVSLTDELRKAITKTKGSSTGKLVR